MERPLSSLDSALSVCSQQKGSPPAVCQNMNGYLSFAYLKPNWSIEKLVSSFSVFDHVTFWIFFIAKAELNSYMLWISAAPMDDNGRKYRNRYITNYSVHVFWFCESPFSDIANGHSHLVSRTALYLYLADYWEFLKVLLKPLYIIQYQLFIASKDTLLTRLCM